MVALTMLKWFWLVVVILGYLVWTWGALGELRLVIKQKVRLKDADDALIWLFCHVALLFVISFMYFLETKGVV